MVNISSIPVLTVNFASLWAVFGPAFSNVELREREEILLATPAEDGKIHLLPWGNFSLLRQEKNKCTRARSMDFGTGN